MAKVKVVHVKDSRGLYGGERAILTLARHLDRRRFEVVLLTFRGRDGVSADFVREARELGLTVELVEVRRRLDAGAIAEMRRLFRKHAVSIVHTHDFKATLYGVLASMNLGVKRVATAHGSTRDSLKIRAYLFLDERVVYRLLHRIVAVGEGIAADLVRRGVPRRRIEVIPNAIDAAAVDAGAAGPSPRGRGPTVPRAVFGLIGRLFPDKGHRYFLEAFAQVVRRYPAARARIVGDGPLREALAGELRDRKLEDHVSLGAFTADIDAVYRELGAVVIPSLREGLPYVLLEAMARRVPVLATAVGDIPRLIDHGQTGLLVPPGNPQALESCMVRLIEAPDEAQAMAERGYRLVAERYSARRMADATQRLYESLVS